MLKLLLAFTIVVAAFFIRKAIIAGLFDRWPQNHAPGECYLVRGVEEGAEDIILLDDGKALLSSGNRDKDVRHLECYQSIKGRILLFDFNKPKDPVRELTIKGDIDLDDFFPHGMAHRGPHPDGSYTIYVVSHCRDRDHVEVFYLDPGRTTLTHKRTITDPVFGSINDLVVVGDHDEFYITNFRYFNNVWGQIIEINLLVSWGQLIYYDGSAGRVVYSGYGWANGVNVSPDHRYLYMAESVNQKLHVFNIEGNIGSPEHIQTVDLHTCPDNIDVSKNGDLWIGCHPMLWAIGTHVAGREFKAPSQVLHLKSAASEKDDHVLDWTITEVYSDSGHRLQGSSAAANYQHLLLIGSVTHKAVVCHLGELYV